ncbi:uncharacterized protein METZ01_LOCUS478620, partial [marine metagenome]
MSTMAQNNVSAPRIPSEHFLNHVYTVKSWLL